MCCLLDRGPPAARRRAGHRQDDARQGDRRVDLGHVEARPVHARPAAHRHHRRDDLRPARHDVQLPRRARLHQRADRRRDQPRQPEDPVGAARGDGGASGHVRRHHPPRPAPVLRDRHPEPARLPGHVPAARRAARPVHDAPHARLRRPGDRGRRARRVPPSPPRRPGPRRHRHERARPDDRRGRPDRGRRVDQRLHRPARPGSPGRIPICASASRRVARWRCSASPARTPPPRSGRT